MTEALRNVTRPGLALGSSWTNQREISPASRAAIAVVRLYQAARGHARHPAASFLRALSTRWSHSSATGCSGVVCSLCAASVAAVPSAVAAPTPCRTERSESCIRPSRSRASRAT